MAYHNLLSKNDRALVAYLVSKGVGTSADVFAAKRSQNKSLPCTICWSEKGEEAGMYSGTYNLQVSIMVKTSSAEDAAAAAAAARLASEARVAATFDCFQLAADLAGTNDSTGENIADQITAAGRALAISDPTNNADMSDYCCLNVRLTGIEAGFEEEGDAWIDTFNLEILACPNGAAG